MRLAALFTSQHTQHPHIDEAEREADRLLRLLERDAGVVRLCFGLTDIGSEDEPTDFQVVLTTEGPVNLDVLVGAGFDLEAPSLW